VSAATYLGGLLAKSWQPWQSLLLGLVVLAAVGWLPVIGGLLVFGAITSGFGAMLIALYCSRQRPDHPQAGAMTAQLQQSPPAAAAAAPQHG
jgi:sorbitol-specific phosphotransferase system component IIBC